MSSTWKALHGMKEDWVASEGVVEYVQPVTSSVRSEDTKVESALMNNVTSTVSDNTERRASTWYVGCGDRYSEGSREANPRKEKKRPLEQRTKNK
jgi:hypothetical protein